MKFDTIIVGAGLAGASAALALSQHETVLIVEEDRPGAGASGVAGGLFSPMIALRGRPVWRIDEAIDAFQEQLDTSDARDLYDGRGVLRPVKEERQITFFKQSCKRYPTHGEWLTPEASAERYPAVHAPMGSMFVQHGGAISTARYAARLVDAAVQRGATLWRKTKAVGWGEEDDRTYLEICDALHPSTTDRLFCKKLILAVGRTFFEHTGLQELELHAVKGQTARISCPPPLDQHQLLPVSGNGYLIPEGDTIAIGSSFEHQFTDDLASRHVSESLLNQVSTMVPALKDAEILTEQVGIRVTVPKIRLPMVGPLPRYNSIWAFTGFGSKGLLLAPLLAKELRHFMRYPAEIPEDISVRVKTL